MGTSAEYSTHSLLEHINVEVDQQSETQVSKLEVGKQLTLMNGQQLLHCFYLQDDAFLDQENEPQSGSDPDTFIVNRDWDLRPVSDPSPSQLDAKER